MGTYIIKTFQTGYFPWVVTICEAGLPRPSIRGLCCSHCLYWEVSRSVVTSKWSPHQRTASPERPESRSVTFFKASVRLTSVVVVGGGSWGSVVALIIYSQRQAVSEDDVSLCQNQATRFAAAQLNTWHERWCISGLQPAGLSSPYSPFSFSVFALF